MRASMRSTNPLMGQAPVRRASVYVPQSSFTQLSAEADSDKEDQDELQPRAADTVSAYRQDAPLANLFVSVRADFERAYALKKDGSADAGGGSDSARAAHGALSSEEGEDEEASTSGNIGVRVRFRCKSLVTSCLFQAVVTLAIVLNSAVIGFETDDPDYPGWDKVEMYLTVFFTVEISMRLFVFGWATFFDVESTDYVWNVFDFIVVSIGLLDLLCKTLFGDQMGSGGGVAMVVRGMRLSRILRIFRLVRFARRLYVLAYGFTLAAVSVFWVTFLMTSVLYICAIILVRTLGHSPEDDPEHKFFKDHFGTVMQAMFTLFQLSVQPEMMEYHHLLTDRPFLIVFLVFFIIFGSFGMIALLTGVISEAMFEKNILRSEEERTERDQMFKTVARACAEIFDNLQNHTEEGEATREDLVKVLPKVARVFEDNGLPYTKHDLVCMLELMDTDASGSINRTEFCRGILQIVEDVRPMLIMELHYDSITYFKNRIDKCDSDMNALMEEQASLYTEIHEIVDKLKAGAASPETAEVSKSGRHSVASASSLASVHEEDEHEETLDTPPPPRAAAGRRASGDADGDGDAVADAELEATVTGLQNEVGLLRGSCASLEKRLEELASSMIHREADQQQDELASQKGCTDIVAGVAQRVGECEFAVRQLCGFIAGVALQTGELGKSLQVLEDHQKKRRW